MKTKLSLVLTALVTASIAYAVISYAGGSKSAASQDSAICCDPQATPGK
jgi:hypothetical protein